MRSGAIGLPTPRTSFSLSWKPSQHRKARKRNGPADLKGAIFVQRHDYLHRKSQSVYSQTTRTNSELSGSQIQHLCRKVSCISLYQPLLMQSPAFHFVLCALANYLITRSERKSKSLYSNYLSFLPSKLLSQTLNLSFLLTTTEEIDRRPSVRRVFQPSPSQN